MKDFLCLLCLLWLFPVRFPRRFQEPAVGVVVVFYLKLVAEIPQETFKCLIFIRWDLQRREDAAKIRSVISVMKEADVPLASQGVQKLQQCSRTFRKFESAQAFAFDVAGMA